MILPAINLRMWAIQMSAHLEQPNMETLISDAEMLEEFVLSAAKPTDGGESIQFTSDMDDKRH